MLVENKVAVMEQGSLAVVISKRMPGPVIVEFCEILAIKLDLKDWQLSSILA